MKPEVDVTVMVAGHSLESRTDGLIRTYRRITLQIITEEVQVSVGSDHDIIQNNRKTRAKA